MKKLLAAVSAIILCAVSASAAWVEPVRVPEPAKVQSVYRYDYFGNGSDRNSMRRSTKESTVNSVCSILNSLKAGESILNEEAIPKSDITFELRLGKGSAMRYYLYSQNANSSQDKIISQLIENGTKYQGMGFTGGNVSDVISRLSKVSGFEDTGFPPFKMSMDISEIRLFNYRDRKSVV